MHGSNKRLPNSREKKNEKANRRNFNGTKLSAYLERIFNAPLSEAELRLFRLPKNERR